MYPYAHMLPFSIISINSIFKFYSTFFSKSGEMSVKSRDSMNNTLSGADTGATVLAVTSAPTPYISSFDGNSWIKRGKIRDML